MGKSSDNSLDIYTGGIAFDDYGSRITGQPINSGDTIMASSSIDQESHRLVGKRIPDMDNMGVKLYPALWNKIEESPPTRMEEIVCLSADANKLEGLLKAMRCSFCHLISADCRVCAEGHLTCNGCVEAGHVKACTFEKVNEDGFRELCLERCFYFKLGLHRYLVQNLDQDFRCENWMEGCEVKMHMSEISKHELWCEMRPNNACPYPDCDFGEFTAMKLVNHLSEVHNTMISEFAGSNVKEVVIRFKAAPDDFSDGFTWTPTVLYFAPYHFFLTLELEQDMFSIWVYRLERKRKCGDKYVVEMKLKSNDQEMQYKVRAHPQEFYLPRSMINVAYTVKADYFWSTFTKYDSGYHMLKAAVNICNA